MFHTLHRTRVSGAGDFTRESDRLVDELGRRGFFVGLGSGEALRALAETGRIAEGAPPPSPPGPLLWGPGSWTQRRCAD
jgi:hypothetical protein